MPFMHKSGELMKLQKRVPQGTLKLLISEAKKKALNLRPFGLSLKSLYCGRWDLNVCPHQEI